MSVSPSPTPRFGQEVRATATLALPLVLGHVSTGLIGFVDNVIAGHHATATLAAVTVGTALLWLPMMVPIGTLIALTASVSQLHGARRHDEIGPLFRQALWLSLGIGALMFFFLSLAFVKRYAELYALQGEPPELRVRGYYPTDLQLVAVNGAVSGYISVLVAALYINSDRVVGLYARPELLWLICPLLLYWISRMWMLAFRGQMYDDPVLFAIKDRESWVVGLLIAAVLLLARLL